MRKLVFAFLLTTGIFYAFYDFNIVIPGSPGKYTPVFTFLCGKPLNSSQTGQVKVSSKSEGEEDFIRAIQRSFYKKLRAKELRR